MPDVVDPTELKRRLSPQLLDIPGVSGVGVRNGRLTVYLDADDDAVRRRVQSVVTKAAPSATPDFVVTGPFRAQ